VYSNEIAVVGRKAGKTDHTSLDLVRMFSVKTSGAVHLMGKTVALPTKLQSGLSEYRASPKSLIFTTPWMFSRMYTGVKDHVTVTMWSSH
jgi:hypothetical protein